jgi:hypothetical protein
VDAEPLIDISPSAASISSMSSCKTSVVDRGVVLGQTRLFSGASSKQMTAHKVLRLHSLNRHRHDGGVLCLSASCFSERIMFSRIHLRCASSRGPTKVTLVRARFASWRASKPPSGRLSLTSFTSTSMIPLEGLGLAQCQQHTLQLSSQYAPLRWIVDRTHAGCRYPLGL